jgi:hypothetical protein
VNKKTFMAVMLASAIMLSAGFFSPVPVHADSLGTVQIVDPSGAASTGCPIALDSNNVPHIAYTYFNYTFEGHREITFNVMYATWNGLTWANKSIGVGEADSIALDANGNPHIIYVRYEQTGLLYASWTGSNWDTQTIDPNAALYNNGFGTLALDSEDNPHIAFTNGATLYYASSTQTTNWIIQTVHTSPNVTSSLSAAPLALDSNNNPYILWTDSGDVQLSTLENSSWTTQTVASNSSYIGNVVLDSKGYPQLTYTDNSLGAGNNTLVYARWNGTVWEKQSVVTGLAIIIDLGLCLALDSYGYPHISYITYEKELMYASWTGLNWNIQTLDPDVRGFAGGFSYLAFDSNGNPHLSYTGFNYPSGDVKYVTITEPAPIFSPTLSPSLTPSPTQQPTPEPTQSAAPTLEPKNSITSLLIIAGIIILIIVAVAGVLVYFKWRTAKRE